MTAAEDRFHPASAPWRTWGSGVVCTVTSQGENAGVLGVFDSPGPAEAACADHNAVLDLAWLAEGGFTVELSRAAGGQWRVSLALAPVRRTAMCGHGASPGEALAKARKWAEARA